MKRRFDIIIFSLLPLAVLGPVIFSHQKAVAQTNRAVAPSRPELIYHPKGNFSNNTARPLRYWPDGTDFVITNGAEFFNRPLYCLNSGLRMDGGDKPEFSLYLPGRGGNLRFGIKTSSGVKWLNDARQIVTRYRPGSLLYEIRDPLLGDGVLNLTVLPLSETKGFIARAEFRGAAPAVELIWAYGGANGVRGARDGDIGTERVPVAEFFQMQPEQCRSNVFSITENSFTMRDSKTIIAGIMPPGAKLSVADATKWKSAEALLASAGTAATLPVVVGQVAVEAGKPVYLALQQLSRAGQEDLAVYREINKNSPVAPVTDDKPVSAYKDSSLPKVFAESEEYRRSIAERVKIETPDPFINAAAAALCIAADAVWDDKQQSFMHGAVAWRARLLGWRGSYTGDALGWHERTAAHFAGYAKQQNTNSIPEKLPPADEQFNLARNEAGLHSNGDLTKTHYDMNLVGVDAFFRHLLWTGDLDYARQMWPVIERHLAWEKRLFRREFGPDKLPLYEAYAAIWASDDLNYNGGGVTHSSAYNYFHNKMAARVAALLDKDPTPYQTEADLILRAMQKYLWLPEQGSFAEYKDYLGLQMAHPNAGLWTFYHAVDSEVMTPTEAWQMSRWIDENIAHIPIQISNSKSEIPNLETNLSTLPETSWMPYLWSINNVVMAEAAHTSLAFWQANRRDAAFSIFKGELLDSMYLGLCPGNVGAMTGFDMARGEAQRDFADAIGINSRAFVEGLFGVRPDALAGELKIVPGFPAQWDHASIQHPDFNFSFQRDGLKETYIIEQKFAKPMALNLQITALCDGVASVTVNGREPKYAWVQGEIGLPRLNVGNVATARTEVVVTWRGGAPKPNLPPDVGTPASGTARTDARKSAAPEAGAPKATDWGKQIPAGAKMETVDLTSVFNDRVTQIFRNEYRTPRSPFVSLALPWQGLNGWCEPTASFDVNDSGLRALAAKNGGKITMPNGLPFKTPGETGAKNVVFTSQWDNYPREASVPLAGKSSHAYLLMAGSTGPMQSRFDNGEAVVTYTDGTTARLALNNPVNWWPIDQDYFLDDFAFRQNLTGETPVPLPPRIDLKTGKVRLLDLQSFKGKGGKVSGGAATVLDLPLNPNKELKSLTVRSLANEVVIGLMSVTLER
jgi:Domain of unknown function (DUF4450)